MTETGRWARRSARTRSDIVTAAQTLFAERGFAHTPVALVAETADVAVATVFNHFPQKQAMFFADRCPWELLAVRDLPALGPDVPVGTVLDLLTAAVERHLGAMADPANRRVLEDLLHQPVLRHWERDGQARTEAELARVLAGSDHPGVRTDPERVAAHLVTEMRLAMDAGRLASWAGTPVAGPPVAERCSQVLASCD